MADLQDLFVFQELRQTCSVQNVNDRQLLCIQQVFLEVWSRQTFPPLHENEGEAVTDISTAIKEFLDLKRSGWSDLSTINCRRISGTTVECRHPTFTTLTFDNKRSEKFVYAIKSCKYFLLFFSKKKALKVWDVHWEDEFAANQSH